MPPTAFIPHKAVTPFAVMRNDRLAVGQPGTSTANDQEKQVQRNKFQPADTIQPCFGR